jgi:hypothetical protein
MMLAHGADVNPKLSFYTKPLHEAVLRGKGKRWTVLFVNATSHFR